MQLDSALTVHQLRCNGIIEATRVMSMGFSCRTTYEQLRHRYEILSRAKPLPPTPAPRDWCPLFLASLGACINLFVLRGLVVCVRLCCVVLIVPCCVLVVLWVCR